MAVKSSSSIARECLFFAVSEKEKSFKRNASIQNIEKDTL